MINKLLILLYLFPTLLVGNIHTLNDVYQYGDALNIEGELFLANI